MHQQDDAKAIIRLGHVELDQGQFAVRYAGRSIHLEVIEYRLLAALIRKGGEVVTYRTFAEHVFGWDESDEPQVPKILAAVVHRIGRRLAAVNAPNLIQCVEGTGYRLVGGHAFSAGVEK